MSTVLRCTYAIDKTNSHNNKNESQIVYGNQTTRYSHLFYAPKHTHTHAKADRQTSEALYPLLRQHNIIRYDMTAEAAATAATGEKYYSQNVQSYGALFTGAVNECARFHNTFITESKIEKEISNCGCECVRGRAWEDEEKSVADAVSRKETTRSSCKPKPFVVRSPAGHHRWTRPNRTNQYFDRLLYVRTHTECYFESNALAMHPNRVSGKW